jgi:acyl-CoA thioesterase-1
MSGMSYEQHSVLHQFLHPGKSYPTLDEAAIAGTLGTPIEMYRQIKAELAAGTHRAAEELLADPDFAARVDRLPFAAGSTVTGLGDSITDDLQSWIEILRNLLSLRRPQDNIRVLNAGFSGDTTTNILRRFIGVVAENPAWIICMIGTNDATRQGSDALGVVVSPQETEKNLALMRHYAEMHTSAKWVWITPYAVIPEMIASHWFLSTLQLEIRNEDINAVVEAVRRQPDPIVDLQKALGLPVNPDYMLDDGLHPSLSGQKAIVRALVERLT